jgi:hypothetical protein
VAAVAEITQMAQQVLEREPAHLAGLRAPWHDPRSPELLPTGAAPDGAPALASGYAPAARQLFPQGHLAATMAPGGDTGPANGGPDAGPPADRVEESDPLVAVLGTAGDLAVDHLRAGFALQRVLLTLTDLGLSCSLFSQPIEVPSAREQLRLALGRFGTPQMVLRVGYGDPGPRSARRPVEEVIDP